MVDIKIKNELVAQLDKLPVESQRRVLNYARSLGGLPRGMSGAEFVRTFAGTITPDDCRLMEKAIEDGCERIDADAWK